VRELAATIAANGTAPRAACKPRSAKPATIRSAREPRLGRAHGSKHFRSETTLKGKLACLAEKRAPRGSGRLMRRRRSAHSPACCKAAPRSPLTESGRSTVRRPSFYKGTKSFLMFPTNHPGDGRLAIWCAAPDSVGPGRVLEEPTRFFVPRLRRLPRVDRPSPRVDFRTGRFEASCSTAYCWSPKTSSTLLRSR